MTHHPSWYARQLAWTTYCLSLAQRHHSDEELRMATLALSVHPDDVQRGLQFGIDHAANVG